VGFRDVGSVIFIGCIGGLAIPNLTLDGGAITVTNIRQEDSFKVELALIH